jgi:hypothetical protein
MGNDAREFFEPEKRELGKNAPFVGNGRGKNDVEGGKAIGGDDEKPIAEVVDIANLAAASELESGKFSL